MESEGAVTDAESLIVQNEVMQNETQVHITCIL